MFKSNLARSLALLSVFLSLPVLIANAAPDAGVVIAAVPPGATPPVATSTTTVSTVTTGKQPMLNDYTVLIGGSLMVLAFFVRKKTTGWLHTDTGSLVIVLVSSVLTSCAEAIQQKGFSKSVLIAAAGQAFLSFVAIENSRKTPPTTDAVLPPDPPAKS